MVTHQPRINFEFQSTNNTVIWLYSQIKINNQYYLYINDKGWRQIDQKSAYGYYKYSSERNVEPLWLKIWIALKDFPIDGDGNLLTVRGFLKKALNIADEYILSLSDITKIEKYEVYNLSDCDMKIIKEYFPHIKFIEQNGVGIKKKGYWSEVNY